MGAYGHKHFPAIEAEHNIPRPVPAAAQSSSTRNIRHNHFLRTTRFEVSIHVRITDDRVSVRDINVFGLRPGRIERNPERLVQTRGENRSIQNVPICAFSQHLNRAWAALGDEQVPIGRGDHFTRVVQFVGEQFDRESLRRFGPSSVRTRHHARSPVDRRRGERLGHIFNPDEPPDSRFVHRPAAHSCFASEHLLPRVGPADRKRW